MRVTNATTWLLVAILPGGKRPSEGPCQMMDRHWRKGFEQGLRPIGSHLRRKGVSPDLITAVGVVSAAGAAVSTAIGALNMALLLLGVAGACDLLDGAVAKAAGPGTPRGSFIDSVADRVSDALLLGGVAWYLAANRGAELAVLPLGVLAATMLVSYERAKAESLGFDARGGLMERGERMVALGIGLLFDGALVVVLWLMFFLTSFTALQRFLVVLAQASGGSDTFAARLGDGLFRTGGRRRRPRRQARARTSARWRERLRERRSQAF